MTEGILGQRVVIVGGSVAGMLAARAVADFFTEVVILEADKPWLECSPRKRVPQSNHSHVLLRSGQQVLDELFPNFIDELIQKGSIVTDFTYDLEWYHFGVWKKRFKSGIRGIQQTRPLLEWHLRQRLMLLENITFQNETTVCDVLSSHDKQAVTGVLIRKSDADDSKPLHADLIIDASGYASQSVKWIGKEKSLEPLRQEVKINLFYATRYYRKNSNYLKWKNIMISAQLPEQPFAGVVLSFEENLYGVTLGGYLENPPKTDEEFMELAKLLPQPQIYNFIQSATPVSDFKTYRIPYQERKQLSKVQGMPARFLILGDAFCRFDPLYGQGMSVAALESLALLKQLKQLTDSQQLDSVHTKFYKSITKITKDPWDMATTEAFRHPDITGDRPIGIHLKHWLTKRIYKASARDNEIYMQLAKVMNLMEPSRTFFKPSLLSKILLK